jgi:ABC-type amino acid transport substrate-binding protein
VDRESFARFTRPINMARNVLLLRAEVASMTGLHTLSALADTKLSIGIQAGGIYGEEYERLIKDPRFAQRLNPVSTPRASWRMLAEGRLDGMITDEVNALVLRTDVYGRVPLEQVLILSSEPSRIMVGRHLGAEKAEALDEAIGAMVSEGWLPRLREAWIPCVTDPQTMGCRVDPRADGVGTPSASKTVDF